MQNNFQSFKQRLTNPVNFRLFLLSNLPAAYFAGLKITSVSEQQATVSVPFKWFTKNPFRSLYFAVLSMAAEMSTGILGMGHLYKQEPAVSMLIVNMQGSFHKKATGLIQFTCSDGEEVRSAIAKAINTGEGVSVTCISKGYNAAQELVAEFSFTWSFKAKTKK